MKKDIIIIGGGPAGLSFARSLKNSGLDILIIEKQPEKILAAPAYDGREIALTHLSKEIMQQLGAWDRIPTEHLAHIREAKVMDGNSPYSLHFNHEEVNEETLGYLVSNHAIRTALYEEVKQCDNVTLLCETTVKHTTTHTDEGIVTLENGDVITASLVIAADTRFSQSRKDMGINAATTNYKRVAILSKMQHKLSHNETAFEYFRYGGTMAVLPLNNDQCSIVITVPTEKSQELLAMDEKDFTTHVQNQLEDSLGDMHLMSERYTYPLVGVLADRFISHRFALLGDAAVGMHPVTAHGFNLGLSGAFCLASQIVQAQQDERDIGSREVLEYYQTEHMKLCKPLYLGTNTIVKLFTNDKTVPKILRKAMLRLGNNLPPARKKIMHQLTEIKAASQI